MARASEKHIKLWLLRPCKPRNVQNEKVRSTCILHDERDTPNKRFMKIEVAVQFFFWNWCIQLIFLKLMLNFVQYWILDKKGSLFNFILNFLKKDLFLFKVNFYSRSSSNSSSIFGVLRSSVFRIWNTMADLRSFNVIGSPNIKLTNMGVFGKVFAGMQKK